MSEKTTGCSASWPADSSFWKFDKCKQAADGIYLENDKRIPFCELHGRHKKLVAKFKQSTEVGNA